MEKDGAASLVAAFLWYVAGLVCTTIAYVFAYISQGMFLGHSGTEAIRALGLAPDPDKSRRAMDRYERVGNICIRTAVVLTVVSLMAFVTGSAMAMCALT